MTQPRSGLGLQGLMTATIRTPEDIDAARITGVDWVRRQRGLIVVRRRNAFVNQGLENVLDLAFSLGGSVISHIAVSGDTSAVTASTTTIGTPNSIKSISPAATRTDQTVSGGADWDEGDVNFAIAKVGFLSGASATAVQNIIGGTGGSSPYDEEFTIDLTAFNTFDLAIDIEVTAEAT